MRGAAGPDAEGVIDGVVNPHSTVLGDLGVE